MPKQVDHQQRRRQIADALWRVVGSRGFDAVSLRSVAGEAGVSMGLVQHYFRTREQMLQFALDSVAERVGQRYAAELAGLPDPPPPRAAVRALLVQMLPLDDDRRREGHSLYAFLASALGGGAVGERLRTGIGQMREFVTAQVVAAGVDHDPQRAANTLLALTDGLAGHLLGGFLSPRDALAAFDAQLDAVFGGP